MDIHGYPQKICGYGYGYGCEISYPRQPWKLSMGPIRGPYSLYPRHVGASMLPKKETKHLCNAFQMTSQKPIQNDHESLERKRIMNNHKLLY